MGLWDDLMSMRGGNNAIGRGVKSLDDAIAAWVAKQGYETTKNYRPRRDPQTGDWVSRREEITVNPVQSLLDVVQFGATLTDPQDYVELGEAGQRFSAQPSLPGGVDLMTAGSLAALPFLSGGLFRGTDRIARGAEGMRGTPPPRSASPEEKRAYYEAQNAARKARKETSKAPARPQTQSADILDPETLRYSEALLQARNAPMKSASYADWRQYLLDHGVKKEELEYSHFDRAHADYDAPLSKEYVNKFFEDAPPPYKHYSGEAGSVFGDPKDAPVWSGDPEDFDLPEPDPGEARQWLANTGNYWEDARERITGNLDDYGYSYIEDAGQLHPQTVRLRLLNDARRGQGPLSIDEVESMFDYVDSRQPALPGMELDAPTPGYRWRSDELTEQQQNVLDDLLTDLEDDYIVDRGGNLHNRSDLVETLVQQDIDAMDDQDVIREAMDWGLELSGPEEVRVGARDYIMTGDTDYASYGLPGMPEYRETIYQVPPEMGIPKWDQGHSFGQVALKHRVPADTHPMHLRTLPNYPTMEGERTYLALEMQSDRAQKGRNRGRRNMTFDEMQAPSAETLQRKIAKVREPRLQSLAADFERASTSPNDGLSQRTIELDRLLQDLSAQLDLRLDVEATAWPTPPMHTDPDSPSDWTRYLARDALADAVKRAPPGEEVLFSLPNAELSRASSGLPLHAARQQYEETARNIVNKELTRKAQELGDVDGFSSELLELAVPPGSALQDVTMDTDRMAHSWRLSPEMVEHIRKTGFPYYMLPLGFAPMGGLLEALDAEQRSEQ